MKRHSFWQFMEREKNDLNLIVRWVIVTPVLLVRRLLLGCLALTVMFYLFFILPSAVYRLVLVYHALQ